MSENFVGVILVFGKQRSETERTTLICLAVATEKNICRRFATKFETENIDGLSALYKLNLPPSGKHPALFDTSFTLRQLHFVKGDCVRTSMSDYYGFRVKSKGVLPR